MPDLRQTLQFAWKQVISLETCKENNINIVKISTNLIITLVNPVLVDFSFLVCRSLSWVEWFDNVVPVMERSDWDVYCLFS